MVTIERLCRPFHPAKLAKLSLEKKVFLVFFCVIWMLSLTTFSVRWYRQNEWRHATGTVIGKKLYKQKGNKKLYNPFISYAVTEQYKNNHGKVKTQTTSYTFTSVYAGKENHYPNGVNVDVVYNNNKRDRAEMATIVNKKYNHSRIMAGALTLAALLLLAPILWKEYQEALEEEYDEEATVQDSVYYGGGQDHEAPKGPTQLV